MTGFTLVPDLQIFETCYLAREKGSIDHPCLKLFIAAWRYYIDSREQVISVTNNLDRFLVDHKYKSDKKKRQALFSVIRVREDVSDAISQLQLAAKLSIEEDKAVYFVTDNKQITDILTQNKNLSFKVIDSASALRLFSFK